MLDVRERSDIREAFGFVKAKAIVKSHFDVAVVCVYSGRVLKILTHSRVREIGDATFIQEQGSVRDTRMSRQHPRYERLHPTWLRYTDSLNVEESSMSTSAYGILRHALLQSQSSTFTSQHQTSLP